MGKETHAFTQKKTRSFGGESLCVCVCVSFGEWGQSEDTCTQNGTHRQTRIKLDTRRVMKEVVSHNLCVGVYVCVCEKYLNGTKGHDTSK